MCSAHWRLGVSQPGWSRPWILTDTPPLRQSVTPPLPSPAPAHSLPHLPAPRHRVTSLPCTQLPLTGGWRAGAAGNSRPERCVSSTASGDSPNPGPCAGDAPLPVSPTYRLNRFQPRPIPNSYNICDVIALRGPWKGTKAPFTLSVEHKVLE